MARELLTEIAQEARQQTDDLRWFHVGGNKPRAVIIMRRGANKERVKTISPKLTPEAWNSWKPVLAELLAERQATGKRRVSHKGLKTGKI